ncbi:urease accessory protein UreD [Paracoccus aestuariivivens]|uniref:Urease accessory protein UreD n=1 Tax=Paracoccus aestuariivivens TaxID=1820333 RepID=A0A6L6J3D7_9RHOB|nr:urease accessory protein UreD [Paracoccus aestuariivivens]MTH76420.1 urease accessory protein UreD [Paracoccus aestuariivivens]
MLHQNLTTDLPRARGTLRAGFVHSDGVTRIGRLFQAGSAKAMLPPAPSCEMVLLNTSGGLTGGDRMEILVDQPSGSHLTVTTQTAERAYRSTTGRARVTSRFVVAAGAHLDLLPQETILFDRSALLRDQEIELSGDATCLWVETLILGRAAMGETVRTLDLTDRRRITRDGRPVFIENLRLDDTVLAQGNSAATLAGNRAFATLVLVATDAADRLGRARDAIGDCGAASAFDGKLVARLTAEDGWPLRQALMRLIRSIRPGPLPRVWQI